MSNEELSQAPGELPEYDHAYDEVVNPIVQRYQEHMAWHNSHGTVAEDTLDQLPGFIGFGADKVVFKAEIPGADPIAIKVMRRDPGVGLGRNHELSDDEVAQVTREHAAPLQKASGTPKLEQLLTADPERGVLVTSFFEGKTATKMKWRDFRAITLEDLSELQLTMATMRELGLVPENKESIIFKRGEGFSIVDYMEINGDEDSYRVSTIHFDNLEDFIRDITVDASWEADRNAAAVAGAPRNSYYERPVVRGMARSRLLKMAKNVQQ